MRKFWFQLSIVGVVLGVIATILAFTKGYPVMGVVDVFIVVALIGLAYLHRTSN